MIQHHKKFSYLSGFGNTSSITVPFHSVSLIPFGSAGVRAVGRKSICSRDPESMRLNAIDEVLADTVVSVRAVRC